MPEELDYLVLDLLEQVSVEVPDCSQVPDQEK